MRQDLTDISIVLDRSGSMSAVRDDTIGGFNAFIEGQRKVPGECNVSLMQFDDQFDTVYSGKAVAEAPLLNAETFVPRGSTALLDAIGRTINATGARLSALTEDQRPAKVLFVIVTDGGENASKEFNRAKVFEMIGTQKSTYKWDFVFLGANQDAIQAGSSLGIAAASSMTYASNSAGTQKAFASVGRMATDYRSGGSATFTSQDRDEQAKAGA